MAQTNVIGVIGIELETECFQRGFFTGIPNFMGTHDASIESELPSFEGIPVETDIPNLGLRNQIFGAEIVSGLINTERDYLSTLKQLTSTLIGLGENEKSYRAGFHVHVNCPYNLRVLKTIMRLGRHLESVFFLLGGMGYDYRGKQNDSIYCRPITKNGPIVVHIYPRSFGQCFNINDLLESSTIDEFKERYGDLEYLNPRTGRYLPVRYHWLNLKPLFEQGSLEFRVFNKSLNPHFLWAIIEFCKAFVLYVISNSTSSLQEDSLTEENSVYDVKDAKDRPRIISVFQNFVEHTSLPPLAVEILLDILKQSDINSIVLPNELTFTHLMNYNGEDRCARHWEHGGNYNAIKLVRSSIKTPNYIDIYSQRRANRENSSPDLSEFAQQSRRIPRDREEREEYLRQRMQELTNSYGSSVSATTYVTRDSFSVVRDEPEFPEFDMEIENNEEEG